MSTDASNGAWTPITAYGPEDDDHIFELACARENSRSDITKKAIAWAEQEIADLRTEREALVHEVNRWRVSAPELVEALERDELVEALREAYDIIVTLGRPETDDTHHAACERIRAALAKATGEKKEMAG